MIAAEWGGSLNLILYVISMLGLGYYSFLKDIFNFRIFFIEIKKKNNN